MKKFNFATKGILFINCLATKCIFPSAPFNFHNFLLRTLKVYEKSFHLNKKTFKIHWETMEIQCDEVVAQLLKKKTTSKKKHMSIIRRLSTFINCKQQIRRGNINWKKIYKNHWSDGFSIADARRQGCTFLGNYFR